MNIKCIQRGGQRSVPFTFNPRKPQIAKKEKNLQWMTEYTVDLEIYQNKN